MPQWFLIFISSLIYFISGHPYLRPCFPETLSVSGVSWRNASGWWDPYTCSKWQHQYPDDKYPDGWKSSLVGSLDDCDCIFGPLSVILAPSGWYIWLAFTSKSILWNIFNEEVTWGSSYFTEHPRNGFIQHFLAAEVHKIQTRCRAFHRNCPRSRCPSSSTSLWASCRGSQNTWNTLTSSTEPARCPTPSNACRSDALTHIHGIHMSTVSQSSLYVLQINLPKWVYSNFSSTTQTCLFNNN